MKGFYLAQQGHFVNALPPVDINGGKNSDVWSMENAGHATIVIQMGVTGATGSVITLEACDDFVPTNVAAIAFKLFKEETAAGDTLDGGTDVAAAGFTSSVNDNIFYVIEVDAAELPAGKPNLRVVLADPTVSTIAAVGVWLSGLRYAGNQNATAIV